MEGIILHRDAGLKGDLLGTPDLVPTSDHAAWLFIKLPLELIRSFFGLHSSSPAPKPPSCHG